MHGWVGGWVGDGVEEEFGAGLFAFLGDAVAFVEEVGGWVDRWVIGKGG